MVANNISELLYSCNIEYTYAAYTYDVQLLYITVFMRVISFEISLIIILSPVNVMMLGSLMLHQFSRLAKLYRKFSRSVTTANCQKTRAMPEVTV